MVLLQHGGQRISRLLELGFLKGNVEGSIWQLKLQAVKSPRLPDHVCQDWREVHNNPATAAS